MLKNPFAGLTGKEWLLWLGSLTVVVLSNLLTGDIDPVHLAGTCVGVTALIFVARGDVWGQILTIVFALLYGITSFRIRYWSEILTYMGMTAPMAALAVVSWLRNPYNGNRNEVKIHRLTGKQAVVMTGWTVVVTALCGWLLWILDTPNLFFSTLSVTTSFLASYLTCVRSSLYALAYAANDMVLIVLWILASVVDMAYLPMIACFGMFFVNDMYGFFSWRKRERRQRK